MPERDPLAPSRGCLNGIGLGLLFWALVGALFLLGRAYLPGPVRTVPEAVLQQASAGGTADVRRMAEAELADIDQRLPLPAHTLSIVEPLAYNGFTVVSVTPVRYSIVVVAWRFASEGQVRFTTAHEVGHMLLDAAGAPQSEQDADLFAGCYGSAVARAWMAANGVAPDPADCARLAQWLAAAGVSPVQSEEVIP